MACGESGGSKILLCLGILVVASSFCHCTRLTRLKALDRLGGNSTLSKGQAEGGDLRHGRLLIGQNSLQADELKGTKATENVLDVDTNYQEDMSWGEPKQPKGQVSGVSRPNSETDSAVVERLLRMEPKVECTGDSMKLQVQDAASTSGSLFFVDRGSHMSPLPLSKLPSSCGYTIKSTQRDLVLVAPYDGCFVALEEDSYVLPLRWCGLPVRMSCPLKRQSSPNPPMVTCHAEGMVVKTTWTVSVADLNLKLNGNWEPLMKASPRCGFSVVVHPEGVVISVRYAPCLKKKDGMYTLELAGDGETQISCPSLTETPSKVEHPSSPSPKNPAQSVFQVPKIPEAPSKKPNQEPKDIYQPPLPSYPNFFYPFPGKPNMNPAPTAQPSPQTVPPAKLPVTPKGQVPQPFIPPPFYLWPAQPEVPVAREGKDNPTIAPIPPEPEAPQGQVHQPFYPYPFYPQPKPEKPTAAPKPPLPDAPRGQVQQPFYPQPEPEKSTAAPEPEKSTAAPKHPQPEAPQGQVQQPFYLYPYPFYPQPKPEKPTAAPKPEPEAPRGQVQQPFYPWPEPEKPTAAPEPEKPSAAPKHPQPEAPQGQVQQPFYPYPYPFYPQPKPEKPTAAPKPKPEAPQGQVQQSFYPQPKPEKPTAAPKPPLPEAPQGQVQQSFYPYPYPYPFYPQPKPEKPTAAPEPEKSSAAPKPPQPEAPRGQVQQPFYPYPFYPQPKPEKPTAAPEPEAPRGQVQQPFYPWPEPEKPTAAPEPEKSSAAPKPPQPEAPQGQVHQPFYPFPFYPQPEPEKPTAAPKPPLPEAPQGQVQQPFYLYPQPVPEKPTAAPKPEPEAPRGQVQQPFYPWPEPEKPTAAPKPPLPEATQGQVQQSFYPYPYPYPFYPQPKPEKPTAASKPEPEAPQGQVQQPFYPWPEPEKPTAAPKPPLPEAPQGQVQQPFYLYPQPVPEKPTAAPKPEPEAPQGKVLKPFYPFYPQPAAVPKPPATGTPKGQEQKPDPQDPQPDSPHMPPVYCPQFCPPGFSNCCPQIAFHQHLHQIVPAGIGSENVPLHYPLLPFLPSKVYNGFGNGLSSAPPPQMPTEATTTSTSAPTSSQSLLYGNEKQPPDGNPAVLNIPSMPKNPEQPVYPYIVPNSLYPNWPYLLQNSPQHQPPAHNNMPSKPQTPGSEPVNPLLQYEPHNLQPPKQQNGQLLTNFMPYNGQYLQQQQNKPTAKELQPSNQNPSESKEPMPPKVQSELDPILIPYYMLQDDQSKTQDKSPAPNPSQPSWSASRKSPKPEQTVHPYSDPESYVLLQHGPPGREPNRLNESPLHFRYPAGDADFLAQNPARQHSGKPQHPEPPHEKPQHPKQPGKEISSSFPNVNYMPRSGDNSDVPLYSLNGPHFAPLPQDPSVSTIHLNPKFKGFWRPMTPLGSGQRIQPLVPGKSFKRRSSTADDQAKGLNQPIQREVGNWKP